MKCAPTRLVLLLTVIPAVLLMACNKPDGSFAFIVIADTHFGENDSNGHRMAVFAESLLTVRDRVLPDSIDGDIASVRGLVLLGDITQDGLEEEWEAFLDVFGHFEKTGKGFSVYEGFGNHDGNVDGPVRNGIRERNPGRPGLKAVSANGLHYAWKWEDVHFLQLNLYPSSEWDPECGWCHYFHESFREPEESLDFLSAYLANHVRNSQEAVVIFFHYGWDDFSMLWWTDNERDLFYDAIKDYHVAGIFTGHRHMVNHFSWRGMDVWASGSPAKPPGEEEFLLVLVNGRKMTVIASRGGAWVQSWEKSLQRPAYSTKD